MKTIRLHATTISIVAAFVVIGKSESVSSLRHLQFDSQPPQPQPTGPIILANCTSDEIPCHDENSDVLSCISKEDAANGMICPCFFNEEQCHDEHLGDYCDTTCCEWGVQERCRAPDLDDPGVYDVWCENLDEGGCPCPDGQMKCNDNGGEGEEPVEFWQRRPHSEHHLNAGQCAAVCCSDDEETCYDDNYDAQSCALIESGGCPCPEGMEKCGGTEDWAGYCTSVCCDAAAGEVTCYNASGKYCSTTGCRSTDESYYYWQSRVTSTILQKGTGSQITYYSRIVNRKKELSSVETERHVIEQLEAEECALFHAIRLKESSKQVKNTDVTTSIS